VSFQLAYSVNSVQSYALSIAFCLSIVSILQVHAAIIAAYASNSFVSAHEAIV